MAKETGASKAKTWLYILIATLTLASMFAGGVMAWGALGSRMDSHAEVQVLQLATVHEEAAELKTEGCKPAKGNASKINLIEYRLNEMRTTQTAIQADTREILKRLPK